MLFGKLKTKDFKIIVLVTCIDTYAVKQESGIELNHE
jgi:hypothetical protein